VESKEEQEVEIEKLAEIKAKRRLDSWSERFKAIWYILLVLWSVVGFFALLWMWIEMSDWIDVHWAKMLVFSFPALMVGAVWWFLYDKHKAWGQQRLREFYEEYLLELKMKE
jgi:glucan phosphoethanolaminetransferase (alkaline phosphatase superfamily)